MHAGEFFLMFFFYIYFLQMSCRFLGLLLELRNLHSRALSVVTWTFGRTTLCEKALRTCSPSREDEGDAVTQHVLSVQGSSILHHQRPGTLIHKRLLRHDEQRGSSGTDCCALLACKAWYWLGTHDGTGFGVFPCLQREYLYSTKEILEGLAREGITQLCSL